MENKPVVVNRIVIQLKKAERHFKRVASRGMDEFRKFLDEKSDKTHHGSFNKGFKKY